MKTTLFKIVIFSFLFCSCEKFNTSAQYTYRYPESIGDGLDVGIRIPGQDSGKCGYTYAWWTSAFSESGEHINMFRAGGWGGQEIMVFPDLALVLVFSGGNYAQTSNLFNIIQKYILPAIL